MLLSHDLVITTKDTLAIISLERRKGRYRSFFGPLMERYYSEKFLGLVPVHGFCRAQWTCVSEETSMFERKSSVKCL